MANLTLDNFDTLNDYETDVRIANINLRELVEFVNYDNWILFFARRTYKQWNLFLM